MPVLVTPQQVLQLVHPRQPLPEYLATFQAGQSVFDLCEISVNPQRVAHFIAQVLCESAELTAREENLHYTFANLTGPNCPFKKHFPPLGNLNPADYVNNPVKLANEFYGTRNGNNQPGDGYAFRGRGLLQLTGRGLYGDATRYLRKTYAGAPDLVASPDAVFSADWSLKVAATWWKEKGCNQLADTGSVENVSLRINGSTQGLQDRQKLTAQTSAIWH